MSKRSRTLFEEQKRPFLREAKCHNHKKKSFFLNSTLLLNNDLDDEERSHKYE